MGIVSPWYVRDGLICWWDGMWNWGVGQHNSSTGIFVNVVDPDTMGASLQRGANPVATRWGSDCLKTRKVTSNPTTTMPAATFASAVDADTVKTVEMVYRIDSPQNSNGEVILLVGGSSNRMAFSNVYTGTTANRLVVTVSGDSRFRTRPTNYASTDPTANIDPDIAKTGVRHTVSFVVPRQDPGDFSGFRIYEGGVEQTSYAYTGTISVQTNGTGSLFGRTNSTAPDNAEGEICCVRMYDRVLSPEEIARNAADDRIRFAF